MKTSALIACLVAFACASVWADTWSWAGKSGDVTIPAGTTATVVDGDIAMVEALTGIAIESGASLTFANTQPITVNANLSGAGAVSANAAGAITLGGDNVNHTGSAIFTETEVIVTSRTGLGSPSRRFLQDNKTSNKRLFFTGAGLTNDVPLELKGDRSTAAHTFAALTDPLVLNGEIIGDQGTLIEFLFGDGWEINGGMNRKTSITTLLYHVAENSTVTFNSVITADSNAYVPWELKAGSKVVFNQAGHSWYQNKVAFYGNGTVVCGADNLYSTGTGLGGPNEATVLDLNGHPQSFPYLRNKQSPSWSVYTPTEGSSGHGVVTSSDPATLTMTAGNDLNNAIQFSGQANFAFTGSGSYALVNRYSDTKGTLSATAGEVIFKWGAGWGGDIALSGSGKVSFYNGTSVATSLNRSGKSKVALADQAKLYLDAGVNLVCKQLTAGGVEKENDVYTKENLGDWIEGDGSIEVRSSAFDGASTWIGEGTGGWADPDNWDNGVPNGENKLIARIVDAQVSVTDADIATVEDVVALWVDAPGAIDFVNTQPVLVAADVRGSGSVSGKGTGAITLAGDNRNHAGALTFSGPKVIVTSRYGLGSASRLAHCESKNLLFTGNGLTNDVPLELTGKVVAGCLTENASDPLVLNGYVTVKSGQYTDFNPGNWKIAEIRRNANNFWFNIVANCHCEIGKLTLANASYAPFNIESGATLTLTGTGSTWTSPIIYGGGAFVCGAENVLPSGKELGIGYNSSQNGTVDLNGFDQTVTTVRHTTYSSWPWNPTDGATSYVTVKSDSPATITMTGNDAPTSSIRYSGKVSLVKRGTGTYTLANQHSDTTGTLDVQAGAVKFAWGAGWDGDITASGSGTKVVFENGSSKQAALNAEVTSKVRLSDGAKLSLGNQVALACAELKVGDTVLPEGTYDKVKQPDWIEGDGTISVTPHFVFEEGRRHVWTGAVDGDLEKAGNWENGDVPSFTGSGTLVFKSGANAPVLPTRSIAAYGLEIVSDAAVTVGAANEATLHLGPGGVRALLPDDATADPADPVVCTVETPIILDVFPQTGNWVVQQGMKLLLNGSIRGGTVADPIVVSGRSDAVGGTIILAGDNAALFAQLKLTDLNVRVLHPNGLGASSRFATVAWPHGGFGPTNCCKFAEDGLTNNVPLCFDDKSGSGTSDCSFVENFDDVLVFNGQLKVLGHTGGGFPTFYVGREFHFRGGVVSEGDAFVFTGKSRDESHVYFDGAIEDNGAYFIISSTLTAHLTGAATAYWKYLAVAGRLICEAENALWASGNGTVYFGSYYAFGNGIVDLNGYDQTIRLLNRYGVSSAHPAATEKTSDYGTVTSATPADFILGQSAGVPATPYPLRVAGQASLVQAGGATNTIVNQKSPTAGSLRVTAGKLLLKWGAGFTNVTSVVVSGGCLEIAEDSARTAFGPSAGRSNADLSISGTGVLKLDGGTVRAKSLTVNGVAMQDGFYGSATCTDKRVPAANRLACIEGEGVVKTGKFGLSVIVR